MKLKLFFSFILIIVLTGCATQAKYQKILDSWIGASEQELIEQWGVPDNTYTLGKLKFLSYKYSDQRVLYGTPPVFINGMYNGMFYPNPVGGTPNMVVSDWCKTTFTIENSKVAKWSFNGNNCTAN